MAKKVARTVLTLVISLILVFFIVKAMPGDPVQTLTQQYMTADKLPYEQAYQRAKIALNYDPEVPVMQQFFDYVGGSSGEIWDSPCPIRIRCSTLWRELCPGRF